jgi:hypothetical protein
MRITRFTFLKLLGTKTLRLYALHEFSLVWQVFCKQLKVKKTSAGAKTSGKFSGGSGTVSLRPAPQTDWCNHWGRGGKPVSGRSHRRRPQTSRPASQRDEGGGSSLGGGGGGNGGGGVGNLPVAGSLHYSYILILLHLTHLIIII